MTTQSKIISILQQKGGVGKTTSTATLAFAIAREQNKRVLVVDCDAQRSLTQYLLSRRVEVEADGDWSVFFQQLKPDQQYITLYDSLEAVRQGAAVQALDTVTIFSHPGAGALFLAPGHADLADFDGFIHSAEDLSRHQPAIRRLPGAPFHAIALTAEQVRADYVLLDLSPNAGALNRCLLMTSGYFFLSSIPDYFCEEATTSIGRKIISTWIPRINEVWPLTAACSTALDVNHRPKFLGTIVSRYHATKVGSQFDRGVVDDHMARNTERWKNRVLQATNDLWQMLEPVGMTVDRTHYEDLNRQLLLGCVRDFHTLGALSLTFNIPVPYLEGRHMVRDNGAGVLEPMQSRDIRDYLVKIQQFRRIYTLTARTITTLMARDQE